MKRLSAWLAALLVAGVFVARAQTPEDRYVRIYNLIQQADALNSEGRFAQALPKYLEAQSALQRIHQLSPEWNPKVVNFRLNYIADKIEAGPGASVPSPKPKTTPPPATPSPTPPPTPIETKPETPPAPAPELSALQNDVTRLQAEKAVLEAKLKEALATQPAAVDPRELAKAQEQNQSLLRENELLKANLETEKAQPKTPAEDKEIADLRSALADSNRKLADQSARANTLLAEQQTLQKRVTQLSVSATDAEALRAENVLLKQQLTQAKSATGTDEANRRAIEAEARVAALQSDMQVLRLEKLALEGRLKTALAAPPAASPPGTSREADAQRINQLEQERNDLQQRLAAATTASPSVTNSELAAKLDQLTKEVTGLRAQVEVFEARSVPYSAEELALFKVAEPKVAATDPNAARKANRTAPAGSAALVAEAQRNFAAKDYAKAEQNYLDILRQDEKNPNALANLATIQMEMGRLDDAEKNIRQALADAPDDGFNLATLGYIKYKQGKYDDALEALSRAAKTVPQNAEIQNYLGVTLSQKGLRGPAETALRKAIQIDPGYGSAHNNLAVIYATQTPPLIELARWHYQKALAAGHPKNPELEKLFDKKEAPAK